MFDMALDHVSAPLQQSAEYVRALRSMGVRVEQLALVRDGTVQGHAAMQVQWWPVVGWIGLISRGPVWTDQPDVATLAQALRAEEHRVLINADGMCTRDLRGAGFLPVMTPSSVAIWDISGDAQARRDGMHQKWRNRLRKAERSRLRLRHEAMPVDPTHWLLAREAAFRKTQKYKGLPGVLAAHYVHANPDQARLFWAEHNGQPVAGMIFLRHGARATYFLGHTDDDGRTRHAHNLLMSAAADWFADQGVQSLDLGALNTVHAPGLARFKLGCGATAQSLGGTWLYGRRLSAILKRFA